MDKIINLLNKRRGSDNRVVVAATAGRDSWETRAGRTEGNDEYGRLDLLRGMKRKFGKRLRTMQKSGTAKAGTACPICLCEPEVKTTTSSREFFIDEGEDITSSNSDELWYVMSSCGHTVCYDCLRAYAENQVKDPEHRGPLKCPVCLSPLREKDTTAALEHDSDLIDILDQKLRDQLLRALPNYIQCPHCCNSNNNNKGDTKGNSKNKNDISAGFAKGGGGFVTPKCLSRSYKQREHDALWWLNQNSNLNCCFLALSLLLFRNFLQRCSSSSSDAASGFFLNCFLNILFLPVGVIFQTSIYFVCRRELARLARRALFVPIVVKCPCCDKEFSLNAEDELSTASITTDEWIGNNTRPCPSCSVPIYKDDGCNHMKCTHCNATFCWACMRLRAECLSYKCKNGAPYRNALSIMDRIAAGSTVLSSINQIRGNPNCEAKDTKDLFIGFTFIALLVTLRDTQIVRTTAKGAFMALASILISLYSYVFYLILVHLIAAALKNLRRRHQRKTQHLKRLASNNNSIKNKNRNTDIDGMTEEKMIAEAKARSLQQQ